MTGDRALPLVLRQVDDETGRVGSAAGAEVRVLQVEVDHLQGLLHLDPGVAEQMAPEKR